MSNVIRVPGVPMKVNLQQQPPYTLLSMETALLIATAAGREVDVNVWFKTNVNRSLMTVREFDSKLKGLATAMGIDQEEDVKRELELSVSQIALRMVHVICGAGHDQYGQPLVDLNYFFKLCQEKVDKYLNEINESGGGGWESGKTSDQNFCNWADGEYDIATGQLITPVARPQQAINIQGLGEDSNAIKLSVEEYIQDSKRKAEGGRPKTAPSGKRAASRGESTEEILLSNNDNTNKSASSPSLNVAVSPLRDNNNMIVETTLTPASPYDEAAEFRDLHDYYEDHHLEAANAESHLPVLPMPLQYGKNYWDEENRTFLIASDNNAVNNINNNANINNNNNKIPPNVQQTTTTSPKSREISTQQSRIAALARPRSSSAPRTGHHTTNNNISRTERYLDQLKYLKIGPLRTSENTIVINERGRSLSRERGGDIAGGVRHSRSETRMSRISLSHHPSSGVVLSLMPEQMVLLKKDVEALVCDTVRQADLYHLIQVNLGFIDNYTMIPPRGAIVKSEKKEWFSKRDIQVAFLAARLTFNDAQLFAWRCLVDDFAKQYPTLYGQTAEDTLAPHSDNNNNNNNNNNVIDSPATALGHPKHPDYLKAEWVKKYLVHLRLAKRLSISNPIVRHSSEAALLYQDIPALDQENNANNINTNNTTNRNKDVPLMWSEWLGKKLQHEMSRTPLPQELQKALQGEKHHLSAASINALLMPKSGIIILQVEDLNQEIELRIESWVLDCDGRRDFQHALNVNIRKWIKDNLVTSSTSPSAANGTSTNVPVDEAAYWRLWEILPDLERNEKRDLLLQKTVNEYRDKLYTSESVHRTISKALYWSYDKFLSESAGRKESFSDWLHKIHFKKSHDRLDRFKEEEAQRQVKVSRLQKRRKAIAPLSVLLQNLEDVKRKTGIPLNASQRREEMKAIVALKKLARTNQQLYMQLYHKPFLKQLNKKHDKENHDRNNHNNEEYADDPDFLDHPTQSTQTKIHHTDQLTNDQEVEEEHLHIVTKEEFDAHIRSIFAPYLPQNDSLLEHELHQMSGNSNKKHPPVSIASSKITAQKLALFRKSWQEKINEVFSGDIHATIQQAMQEYTAKRNAQGKQFQKWLTEKRQLDLKKENEQQDQALRKEQFQEMKKIQGEKAYKKWFKLRRRHKYKSMVDKKAHFVPEARIVAHRERWQSLDSHHALSRHTQDDTEAHRDTLLGRPPSH